MARMVIDPGQGGAAIRITSGLRNVQREKARFLDGNSKHRSQNFVHIHTRGSATDGTKP